MPTSSVATVRGSRVRAARLFRQPAVVLPGLIVLALACVALLGDGSIALAAQAPTAPRDPVVKTADPPLPFANEDMAHPARQAACLTLINGIVWHDIDSDGQNDGTSEPGINGVEMIAYTDDGDGQFEPGAEDAFFASATTALDPYFHVMAGFYEFSPASQVLCLPDRVWIDVSSANFATGGPLEDMILTSGRAPKLILAADDGSTQGGNYGYNNVGTYAITSAPNPPAACGLPVTLSFEIKNTGQTVITTLPLRASYDPTYLAFTQASLAPDNGDNDGTIDWSDLLTAPSSAALAAPSAAGLAPGASITVDMTFDAVLDTTDAPGGATTVTVTSEGAMADPDGPSAPHGPIGPLPFRPTSTDVTIYNPTGISLAWARAIKSTGMTALAWETADESDVLGFNVLRQDAAGAYAIANAQLILAEHAGLPLGAAYTFADTGPTLDGVTYALEIVRLDGQTEQLGFEVNK